MSTLALLGGSKVRSKPFFSAAVIGEEEKRRVAQVLESGMLSGFIARAGEHFCGGRQVREFEALLRDYFKVPYAVTVNSATAGLHAALAACGVSPGDEVLVTPYTMCASATAIVMCGGIPVFSDISENDFCLDPGLLEAQITPRTRGIVVVHLFGRAARMDAIMRIACKHKLFVVEDCAQAPGALYKGKFAGSIGDAGVFSLNQHKVITSGEGGFAITNNPELALRMQLIRNHGEVITQDMNVERIDNIIGYNYRMTELEAAVAIGQFKNLDAWNARRVELAQYLTEKLSVFRGLLLPPVEDGCGNVYFSYPIRIDEEAVGISRDLLVKALNAEGIPCGGGYVRPVYWEPMYQTRTAHGREGFPFSLGGVSYPKGLCPICERMHTRELIVTGVCRYPHTTDDMDDVAEAFGKVLAGCDELKAVARA